MKSFEFAGVTLSAPQYMPPGVVVEARNPIVTEAAVSETLTTPNWEVTAKLDLLPGFSEEQKPDGLFVLRAVRSASDLHRARFGSKDHQEGTLCITTDSSMFKIAASNKRAQRANPTDEAPAAPPINALYLADRGHITVGRSVISSFSHTFSDPRYPSTSKVSRAHVVLVNNQGVLEARDISSNRATIISV